MKYIPKKSLSLMLILACIISWSAVSYAEDNIVDLSGILDNETYDITVDTGVNVAVVETSDSAEALSFNHEYESDYYYSYTNFDFLIKEFFDDPTPLFRLWMIYAADEFCYFNSVAFEVDGKEYSFEGISDKDLLENKENGIKEKLLIKFSEENVDFLTALLEYGISLLNEGSISADGIIIPMTLKGFETVSVDLKANFLVNYLTVVHALGNTGCADYLGEDFAAAVSEFKNNYSLAAIRALQTGEEVPAEEEPQAAASHAGAEYAPIIKLLSESGPWFYNGGSNELLKCIEFSAMGAVITTVSFDFSVNPYAPKSTEICPYDIDDYQITVHLENGFTLDIPYSENGGIIRLGNGEYLTTQEVNNGLQGYWRLKFNSWGLKYEYNVYINNGQITTEDANEGFNLPSDRYYFSTYTGDYTLDYGYIKSSESAIWEYYFNIIDGKPVLMHFDKVFSPSDEGLPGQNGYVF